MTTNAPWNVLAMTARPSTAAASQIKSPRMRPARNGTMPESPPPMTRATRATMPGPGEAAATSSAPVKIRRAVRSIIRSRMSGVPAARQQAGNAFVPPPSSADHLQPQRGAAAVMGVGDGDRQRVGGVGRFRLGLWQQDFQHHGDLVLVGMA